MTNLPDLEIGLSRRDSTSYTVDLRFTDPQSAADSRATGQMHPDLDQLCQMPLDHAEYGQCLTDALFADRAIREKFAHAQGAAGTRPLRLRLTISEQVPELHALRWETLRDPTNGDMLLTSEHILFSRYLSSSTWRPIELRPRTQLRALAVVANPTNLEDYAPTGTALAPIDVASELAHVRAGLGDIPITEIAAGGKATLTTITTHLRDGCDILYLVAHGASQ